MNAMGLFNPNYERVFVKSPTIVIPSEARNLFFSDEIASLLAMTSLGTLRNSGLTNSLCGLTALSSASFRTRGGPQSVDSL